MKSRLVWGGEKTAAITARIVNKLPLVVVIFLVEDADGFFFARTSHSNHRSAAEGLRAGSAESAGRARSAGACGRSARAGFRRTGCGVFIRVFFRVLPSVLSRDCRCSRSTYACALIEAARIHALSGRQTSRHCDIIHCAIGAAERARCAGSTRNAGSAVKTARWNGACDSGSERHLHIAHMQDLEIFSGNWVFITPPQEADLIGVFEFLDAGGITPELLDEMFHRARVLHAAMNQLLLTIAFHLKGDDRQHDHGCDGDEGYEEDQCDQDVSAVGATARLRDGVERHVFLDQVLFNWMHFETSKAPKT